MNWKNLTDKELEEIESGRLPLSIHPHYPFVFIDLILRQDTPPLITLWTLRNLIEFKFPTSPRVQLIVPVAVEFVAM